MDRHLLKSSKSPYSAAFVGGLVRAAESDTYLTRSEAAKFLRVTTRTLDRWHRNGIGPERLPKRVGCHGPRYRLSSIIEHLRLFRKNRRH